MAEWVLKSVIAEIKAARYYTLIVAETKDVSKREQLSLVLRYVFEGVIRERFISYTHCEELHASALKSYILKALDDVQLNVKDCVSQCHDGASVMSGISSGVGTRIQERNSRAIYIHCHADQLNLALVDARKKLQPASDFFSLLERLYVFMSSSVPHCLFIKKQKELGSSREIRLVKLIDTRWCCRHASIKALKSTIKAVLETLQEISEESGSRSVDSRGLHFKVKSFEFILSLIL